MNHANKSDKSSYEESRRMILKNGKKGQKGIMNLFFRKYKIHYTPVNI